MVLCGARPLGKGGGGLSRHKRTTGRACVATAAQRSISSLLDRCRLHGCSAVVQPPLRWLQCRWCTMATHGARLGCCSVLARMGQGPLATLCMSG